jgi:hypothetical protein
MLALLKPESVTPELLAKRLSCLSRDRVEWLLGANMGDIR